MFINLIRKVILGEYNIIIEYTYFIDVFNKV